jgi:hypothetical protein
MLQILLYKSAVFNGGRRPLTSARALSRRSGASRELLAPAPSRLAPFLQNGMLNVTTATSNFTMKALLNMGKTVFIAIVDYRNITYPRPIKIGIMAISCTKNRI